ncbi:neutral/alkaline non-lysosomal ceramidase N-terminal domain-containing protein [Dyadobacter sp. NIV53]|uniref:neutral/alkaline non-lysosomal ceramidase N-terminal domain-containing protein n=1 Tax=Dyadobacter sp. NIV53 TaxID=2861765 RepID=UPI001C86A8A7|nr:neutral/alkaline non-lysosomal ceramidase N-terminal domain-containing protein [Dyadobacter sp. NIV53]
MTSNLIISSVLIRPKIVFAVLYLIFLISLPSVSMAGFRASVVKVDITPTDSQYLLGYGPRKSNGVHDKIYHRIVMMDDGVTQFVIVSSDLALVSPSEYDKVAARLQKEQKISPVNLWWTFTHTHSAPEVGPPGLPSVFLGDRYKHDFDKVYTDLVEQKLIDGIAEARKKLTPAKLGTGWGFASANINRRARLADGKITLGMNPDGPVDRRIGLIRLEKEDGSLLTLIANYAMHGTVFAAVEEISADGPGIVAEYVEEKLGVPMLYINGAAGNIAPLYSQFDQPNGNRVLPQFKVMLGDKIIKANKDILAMTSDVKLRTSTLIVETPRKAGMGWTDDMVNYTRTTKEGVNLVKLPVRFLKINEDVAIWSAPLELFCEISNEIRDRSTFPFTFYFGYGNGWLGYLLTEKEYAQGGYETTVTPYSPKAGQDLTDAVMNYLQGEMKKPNQD